MNESGSIDNNYYLRALIVFVKFFPNTSPSNYCTGDPSAETMRHGLGKGKKVSETQKCC
jgi:hypothetical protein